MQKQTNLSLTCKITKGLFKNTKVPLYQSTKKLIQTKRKHNKSKQTTYKMEIIRARLEKHDLLFVTVFFCAAVSEGYVTQQEVKKEHWQCRGT